MSTGWLASRVLGLDSLIWAEGREQWQPVAKIPELAALLKVTEAALTAAQAAGPSAATSAGARVASLLRARAHCASLPLVLQGPPSAQVGPSRSGRTAMRAGLSPQQSRRNRTTSWQSSRCAWPTSSRVQLARATRSRTEPAAAVPERHAHQLPPLQGHLGG